MRPQRLALFDYSGCHRYFITCCTWKRQLLFNSRTVPLVRDLSQSTLKERNFEVLAWVFMPDHVHWLLQGNREDADLKAAMTLVRQRTAIAFKRAFGTALWQRDYYERVLRKDEDAIAVSNYILNNPVRAGLVAEAADYPLGWSITLSR